MYGIANAARSGWHTLRREKEIFDFVFEREVMMSCRNKRKAYRRKDVRARGSIFYAHTVVGGVVNCIDDKYGGGTHSARRYVLGDAQSEDECEK